VSEQRRKPRKTIPLTERASDAAATLTELFDQCLKGVAENLALDGGAENVLVPHIKEAHLALKRNGLNAPPRWFFQRSDFKVGLGGMLFGSSFSIGGLSLTGLGYISEPSRGIIASNPVAFWALVVVMPGLVGALGVVLALVGWMQSHR